MSLITEDSVADIINLNVTDLCRVCLTRGPVMFSMDCPLSKETPNAPSILEALEKVMSVKLVLDEKYPTTVCGICKGLLKISYDLNVVFNNSQTALNEYFKDILAVKESEYSTVQNTRNVAPVEVIFKNNKYDLKDIVIMEEEEEKEEEKHSFEGFLNNLGKTVSAVFISKSENSEKTDKSSEEANSTTCVTPIEPCNNNGIESFLEITLDDFQGCRMSDLFSDHQIYDFIASSETQVTNEEVPDDQQEENGGKENLLLRKNYKCDACDLLYADETQLTLHLKKDHIHQAPYLCHLCGSVSFLNNVDAPTKPMLDVIPCEDCCSRDTKKKIIDDDEGREVAQDSVREYLCHFCGDISHNAKDARYHRRKHFKPQYQCDVCNKRFSSKANLKWHCNRHSNIKNLLCTICGKKFNYHMSLKYHMASHKNEKKHFCVICDKRFQFRHILTRHLRTHTGERPYACSWCEKAFYSPAERKRHEIVHTGERPYKCQYCEKGFATSFSRNVHCMSHSGPHECLYCSKTFVEGEFLKKHLKVKHKV